MDERVPASLVIDRIWEEKHIYPSSGVTDDRNDLEIRKDHDIFADSRFKGFDDVIEERIERFFVSASRTELCADIGFKWHRGVSLEQSLSHRKSGPYRKPKNSGFLACFIHHDLLGRSAACRWSHTTSRLVGPDATREPPFPASVVNRYDGFELEKSLLSEIGNLQCCWGWS